MCGLTDWVIGHVELRAGDRVGDVGCGPGLYVRRLHQLNVDVTVVALDQSPGMVRDAGGGIAGDVQALPFAAASFDVLLAAHFLYHVADIPAAVAELRGALCPDGTLLVVTNGVAHHRRIPELIASGAGIEHVAKPGHRFDLVNGRAPLEREFGSVAVDVVRSRIVLEDPEPIVRFVDSCEDFYAPKLPVEWPELLERVRAEVAAEIAERGTFEMDAESGVFVCRAG